MLTVVRIVCVAACLLLSLVSIMLLFRFPWSKGGPMLWVAKSFACALAPFLMIAGLICSIAGVLCYSVSSFVLGGFSAGVFAFYYWRISHSKNPATGFEKCFGKDWDSCIPESRKAKFLSAPAALRLSAAAHFTIERDFPFATIPNSSRQLLCDIWKPAGNIEPSGLAFIYLHGSAWYYLDKDAGTRPFFRHLTTQGHVVMDVAYRLFPETDMKGMIQDAKRAIAWMKANAFKYGVDPQKVVIGGGSAGGHLALMAAYTPNEHKLAPPEYSDADLSVNAVVGLYSPPDLKALYDHTGQQITTRIMRNKSKAEPASMPTWMQKFMGKNYLRYGLNKSPKDAGSLAAMLGCHPEDCPELYDYYSPIGHIGAHCPPTLLIQGEHDMFTPVEAMRQFFQKLGAERVPTVMHLLPQTDHAFDLFMPKSSAVAHTAYYFVERFLARIACS